MGKLYYCHMEMAREVIKNPLNIIATPRICCHFYNPPPSISLVGIFNKCFKVMHGMESSGKIKIKCHAVGDDDIFI